MAQVALSKYKKSPHLTPNDTLLGNVCNKAIQKSVINFSLPHIFLPSYLHPPSHSLSLSLTQYI
jgi:hypothetical protein